MPSRTAGLPKNTAFSAEFDRAEAEQFRRFAEEAREVRDLSDALSRFLTALKPLSLPAEEVSAFRRCFEAALDGGERAFER